MSSQSYALYAPGGRLSKLFGLDARTSSMVGECGVADTSSGIKAKANLPWLV